MLSYNFLDLLLFGMQPAVFTSESLINIPPFKNTFLKYALLCG